MRAGQDYYRGLTFEEAEIASFDGLRLHARVCGAEAGKPLLLLFHGWRSSAARDFGCVLEFYRAQGFGLILVDQRAHGKAAARPSPSASMSGGTASPGRAGRRSATIPSAMYLDGISMGAATVLMASEFDLPASVRGIIADCGYTSPRDILKRSSASAICPSRPSTSSCGWARAFSGASTRRRRARRGRWRSAACRCCLSTARRTASCPAICRGKTMRIAPRRRPSSPCPGQTMGSAIWWTGRAWRRR